jgi:hypothetical protein
MDSINLTAQNYVIKGVSREQGGTDMKKAKKLMNVLHDDRAARTLFTGMILCGMGLASMLVTLTIWCF